MRQRILAGIILSLTAATSNAALLSRLSGQAYYDDVLNITWLADANLAKSQTFGLPRTLGYPPGLGEITSDGRMTLDTTATWLAAMNATSYLGVSDWRLPSMDVNGDTVVISTLVDCYLSEVVCRDNEMAYQSWYNGIHIGTNCTICIDGPFTNVEVDFYWSSTGHHVFYFPYGENSGVSGTVGLYAWAVRPGDIVPIPAAVWLLGSALSVLGVMRRRAAA